MGTECKYCDDETTAFWQGLAYRSYGHHLTMKSFSNIFDFIMAIAYREQGADQLEVGVIRIPTDIYSIHINVITYLQLSLRFRCL